jgi:hypothetical protein
MTLTCWRTSGEPRVGAGGAGAMKWGVGGRWSSGREGDLNSLLVKTSQRQVGLQLRQYEVLLT